MTSNIANMPTFDENREAALMHFENTWTKAPPRRLREFWRDGDPLAMLVELVHIDIERHVTAGEDVRVESYLEEFPAIAHESDNLIALLQTERSAFNHLGVRVSVENQSVRFPQLSKRLHEVEIARLSNLPVKKSHNRVERVGRYRVLRQIGEGGMGNVYLAEDDKLERPVALKIPHAAILNNKQTRDRFLTEARAVAKLRHANICQVYDFGDQDGVLFLAMAYVDGTPLNEYLKMKQPFPVEEVVSIVRKTALAVQFAHEAGIIHRDLKPGNVMVDKNGEPVLMDFGLARRDGLTLEHKTSEGQPIGTPAYMPPEQVEGRTADIGPASDVYGLGAILYELLTRQAPFSGTVAKVYADILTKLPTSPAVLAPAAPRSLVEICLKALEKDPQSRFGSAKEFADALDSGTITDRKAGKIKWKRPWAVAILGLIAFVGLLAAFFVFLQKAPTSGSDRSVAEWVLDIGGNVVVLVDGQKTSVGQKEILPASDLTLIGVNVEGIKLVNNQNIVRLKDAKRLRTLELGHTDISDPGTEWIGQLPDLEVLILWHTSVREGTIERMRDLSRLQVFAGTGIPIGNAAFRAIGNCKELKLLELSSTELSDDALATISKLPKLQTLRFEGNAVTAIGLERLISISGLNELVVSANRFGPDEIKALDKLPSLKNLGIVNLTVDEKNASAFGAINSLEILRLKDAVFMGTARDAIGQLKQLNQLSLVGCNITNEDLEVVASLPKLQVLGLAITEISNAGLRHLEKSDLRDLDLTLTKVDQAGIETFLLAKPKCIVHWNRRVFSGAEVAK